MSRRRDIEAEIDEELAFHLHEASQDFEASGMSPSQAEAAARRAFGDAAKIRRACSHERLWSHHMMQRFHMAFTVLLLAALAISAAQWSLATEARDEQLKALRRQVEALSPPTPPTRTDFARFAVGDRIRITDLNAPDRLSVVGAVEPDGMMLLPELGWVTVASRTRDQLETELNGSYAPYSTEAPQIDISLVRPSREREPIAKEVIAQAGDALMVLDEFHPEDTNATVRIEADGTALVRHVGRVHLAGVSRPDLEALLAERLAKFHTDPVQIRVRVLSN